MSLYKPLTEQEKQFVRLFDVRAISEDFIKTTCQPEYLAAKTPEAREFWTNQARKSKQRADRLLFNPDTHCGSCGEFLSTYGHCWQCDYPLSAADDPRESPAYCEGQCGICSCIPSPQTTPAK